MTICCALNWSVTTAFISRAVHTPRKMPAASSATTATYTAATMVRPARVSLEISIRLRCGSAFQGRRPSYPFFGKAQSTGAARGAGLEGPADGVACFLLIFWDRKRGAVRDLARTFHESGRPGRAPAG